MGDTPFLRRLVIVCIFLPRILFPDAFTQLDEQRWIFRSNDALNAFLEGRFSETGSLGYPAVTNMATIAPVIVAYRTVTGIDGHADTWSPEHQHYVLVWGRLAIALVTGIISYGLFIVLQKSSLFEGNPWMAAAVVIGIANEPWLLGMSRIMMMDAYISLFILSSLVMGCISRWNKSERFLVVSGIAFGLAFITKSTASFFGPFLLVPYLYGPWKEAARRAIRWCLVGALTIFICWPAMWVHPIDRIGELFFWNSTHAFDLREPLYWPGYHPPFVFLVLSLPVFVGIVSYVVFRALDWYKRRRAPEMLLGDLAFVMALAFQLVMAHVIADRSRWILPSITLFTVPGVIGLLRLLRLRLDQHKAAVASIILTLATVVYLLPYPTLSINPLFYSKAATWQLGMGEGSKQVASYIASLPEGSSVAAKNPGLIDRYLTYSTNEVTRFPQSNEFSELPENTTHVVLLMSQNRILFEENIDEVYEWMERHSPEHIVSLRGVPLYGIYRVSKEN